MESFFRPKSHERMIVDLPDTRRVSPAEGDGVVFSCICNGHDCHSERVLVFTAHIHTMSTRGTSAPVASSSSTTSPLHASTAPCTPALCRTKAIYTRADRARTVHRPSNTQSYAVVCDSVSQVDLTWLAASGSTAGSCPSAESGRRDDARRRRSQQAAHPTEARRSGRDRTRRPKEWRCPAVVDGRDWIGNWHLPCESADLSSPCPVHGCPHR